MVVCIATTRSCPGEAMKGHRVARHFNNTIHFGTIKQYLPAGEVDDVHFEVWYVTYDDGDDADYNLVDIQAMLTLYHSHCHEDKGIPPQLADGMDR